MSKSEEAMHGITFKDKIGYAMGDMGGHSDLSPHF